MEAKAEETKSTKTHFAKKLPKHVTKVYLDEDQSPDVLYATVELDLPNGSAKKLKDKGRHWSSGELDELHDISRNLWR